MLLNADREFLQNHQNSNFIRGYFYPVDTGPKLNVHKTGPKLNVHKTFNLRPVSTGQL